MTQSEFSASAVSMVSMGYSDDDRSTVYDEDQDQDSRRLHAQWTGLARFATVHAENRNPSQHDEFWNTLSHSRQDKFRVIALLNYFSRITQGTPPDRRPVLHSDLWRMKANELLRQCGYKLTWTEGPLMRESIFWVNAVLDKKCTNVREIGQYWDSARQKFDRLVTQYKHNLDEHIIIVGTWEQCGEEWTAFAESLFGHIANGTRPPRLPVTGFHTDPYLMNIPLDHRKLDELTEVERNLALDKIRIWVNERKSQPRNLTIDLRKLILAVVSYEKDKLMMRYLGLCHNSIDQKVCDQRLKELSDNEAWQLKKIAEMELRNQKKRKVVSRSESVKKSKLMQK